MNHSGARMRRGMVGACWCLVILLTAGAGQAADDGAELKKAWKSVGQTFKEAATETGHAFRDVAKEVDESNHEARKDAGAEGQSFWSDTTQGFAKALDGFSDSLSRLLDGTDE